MALNPSLGHFDTAPDLELRDDDRPSELGYADESGRSNFVAFMLGGVAVAGGLLAFMYYDPDNNFGDRSDLTTGSLGRIEMSAPATTAPSVGPELRPATR